ncbi:MAG: hypothetical protein ABI972_29835 [Acidobacteriota bacterium]
MADIAVELAHAGVDYYFIKPLERANVGFLVQTSPSVGVAGGLQVIGTVLCNIIGRMDRHQLLSVGESIHERMR